LPHIKANKLNRNSRDLADRQSKPQQNPLRSSAALLTLRFKPSVANISTLMFAAKGLKRRVRGY